MASYSWANTNRPAIGTMTATTKFDDVAPWDRTTGETTTVLVNTFTTFWAGTGYLTALCDFGSLQTVSAWQFTGIVSLANNPGNRPGASGGYTLESSSDGSTFTSFASGSLTLGLFNDVSASASVTARYIRLVLTATEFTDLSGQSFTIQLTDFRLTAGAPCTPPSDPTLYAQGRIVNANYQTGIGGYPVIVISNLPL